MKVIILGILFSLSALATAPAGRSLPAGEDDPLYLKRLFTSPNGEVQFLRGKKKATAFFRDEDGDLIVLDRIEGLHSCNEWLESDQTGDLPERCEFVFSSTRKPITYHVTTEEMTEASVFQTVRGLLRGQGRNVAL